MKRIIKLCPASLLVFGLLFGTGVASAEESEDPIAPTVATGVSEREPNSEVIRKEPATTKLKKKAAAKNDAPGKSSPGGSSWHKSLTEGQRSALENRKPMLIVVGGESCPWCKKLAVELAKPAVQSELENWTLVSLDVDKAPSDARRLGVGPIPALRLRTDVSDSGPEQLP